MSKKREELKEEYTEALLERVGTKLSAKRLDDTGQLGDKAELTEEEDLAYEYVMLKVDSKLRPVGYNRYFKDGYVDAREVYEGLGISKRTYFNHRKELLNKLDAYLTAKGYGYDNASNIDRYDLPNRLTLGRYIKSGRDLVYEEPDDGDLYEIYGGAEGLVRYRVIRVVKSLEVFDMLADDDVDEVGLERLPYIVKVNVVDAFGVGLLVTVNRTKYGDFMDDGYVLNQLEVELVEELSDERATEMLEKDTVIVFK